MKSFQTVVIKTPLLSKVLLIMKVTTFLMIAFSLQVSAKNGLGQEKLTLHFKKAEIAGILSHIEKQTNYRFLYNEQLRDIRQKVSLHVEEAPIAQALDILFNNTALTYRFMANNLIVINESKEKQPLFKNVTGKVVSDRGVPLAGVSVNIKGTSRGTTTNEQGIYSLSAEDEDVLVFSYVGFDPQEIKVGNRTEINISLVSSASNLENIVVIGYGTVKKRDLTGAVVSLKGDEVVKVPAGNLMESVQGKLPGVDITRTSGSAGANVNVTVRGNRSIIAQNGPLYIVDGIQYSNFQDINSNDIQSLEVLKDASSTAIYGSRGANGVIIITTKRGNSGKARVSANTYYGVSDVAGYPKPMTGPQFANLKRESYRTIGTWNSPADDPKVFTSSSDLEAVQNGFSTDWAGMLLHKGSQQDYSVSVAGGSDKTKVYFSFDYYREKGLLANDFLNRYAVRLNVDQSLANTFKVGLSSQLTYYDGNSRQDNILTVANKVIPYFSPYDDEGNLAKYPGNGNQVNPLMEEQPGAYVNETNTTRILSTAYAEWKPFSTLSIRSNLGITNSSTRTGTFQGENTITRALSSGSLARIDNSTSADLLWENIVTWKEEFGAHSVDATLVTSYLSNRQDDSYASATGQLIAAQSWHALQNNPDNLSLGSSYVGSNLISGAFRVNYGYKGKYLLTVTGRADGSSVLAKENRWAFFPSAAAAWRVIDENFMKYQHIFDDLKLRVSYGVAGNAAVKPYSTQSGLILIPYSWNDESALAYGLDPTTGNPNLKWELTYTQNIGVDMAFLHNRIMASVDYYDSKTKDLLLLRGLVPTSGVQRILQNIGRTRNSGVEIMLRTVNVRSSSFNWSSGITFSHNKERIVELVGKQNDVANGWFVGYPVNSFYDYQKIGIWQTADAALAASYGYKPGDIRVQDINNDKKFTATDDRTVLGSAVPDYTVGFTNDISFKNFDLNVYVFARQGQMFVSNYANKFEPNAIENGAVVDYWTPENPTNDYPRPTANLSRAALPFATTLGYKDGSFVKIRNITLGYTLPANLTQKFHVSDLRLYVSAKNYFTFSKVDDYDPEGAGSFERPLTKLIVMGLNVGF
jgi:TonB-linked SusC/RagA family outer membrane protein